MDTIGGHALKSTQDFLSLKRVLRQNVSSQWLEMFLGEQFVQNQTENSMHWMNHFVTFLESEEGLVGTESHSLPRARLGVNIEFCVPSTLFNVALPFEFSWFASNPYEKEAIAHLQSDISFLNFSFFERKKEKMSLKPKVIFFQNSLESIEFNPVYHVLAQQLDKLFTTHTEAFNGLALYQLVYDLCTATPSPFVEELYQSLCVFLEQKAQSACSVNP